MSGQTNFPPGRTDCQIEKHKFARLGGRCAGTAFAKAPTVLPRSKGVPNANGPTKQKGRPSEGTPLRITTHELILLHLEFVDIRQVLPGRFQPYGVCGATIQIYNHLQIGPGGPGTGRIESYIL